MRAALFTGLQTRHRRLIKDVKRDLALHDYRHRSEGRRADEAGGRKEQASPRALLGVGRRLEGEKATEGLREGRQQPDEGEHAPSPPAVEAARIEIRTQALQQAAARGAGSDPKVLTPKAWGRGPSPRSRGRRRRPRAGGRCGGSPRAARTTIGTRRAFS